MEERGGCYFYPGNIIFKRMIQWRRQCFNLLPLLTLEGKSFVQALAESREDLS